MTRPKPALRLRLARIEKRPKPVYQAQWADFAKVRLNAALSNELLDIIESIERGDGVPEDRHRAGIDRDKDGLLEEQGIMHLHLGGRNSDVLVFLIQYADRVVLLESNTHMHFRTQPPGRNILALTQSWLNNLERDMQQAAAEAQAAASKQERTEAEERRAQIAKSIARFKSRISTPRSDG